MEGSAGQMNQDGPESFPRSPKGIADWIYNECFFMMIVLGIETSCDETAASIVEINKKKKKVLKNFFY